MSSASASACSRDGDGDTELDLDVNILSRRRCPARVHPLRGTGRGRKDGGQPWARPAKAAPDAVGARPSERRGTPRGAGIAARGRDEARERRWPGGNSAGRAARPAGSQHPLPPPPPARAASILVAWIGWEWQVSRPQASRERQSGLAPAAQPSSVIPQGPGLALARGFGHCTSPPPPRRPVHPHHHHPARSSRSVAPTSKRWLGGLVMGRSHSADTCLPLGVGVVLGNWTCDSNSRL